jgi:hypothetical protein
MSLVLVSLFLLVGGWRCARTPVTVEFTDPDTGQKRIQNIGEMGINVEKNGPTTFVVSVGGQADNRNSTYVAEVLSVSVVDSNGNPCTTKFTGADTVFERNAGFERRESYSIVQGTGSGRCSSPVKVTAVGKLTITDPVYGIGSATLEKKVQFGIGSP